MMLWRQPTTGLSSLNFAQRAGKKLGKSVRYGRGRGKCMTGKWRTKSQGVENAGLEYDWPIRKAWKCRIRKWRTKL